MAKAVVLFALFACVCAVPTRIVPTTYSDLAPVLTDELIAEVNSKQSSWVAHKNAKFDGMTVKQAKVYMGTFLNGPMPPPMEYDGEFTAPDSFDARTAWPDCPSITLVRDQSACGSCWAFGSTESFNDRLCIATGNKAILAAADVLSCCPLMCGQGCNGGYPSGAWEYFRLFGVVPETCFGYPFPACAHHVVSPDYPACPADDYNTPSCNRTCADGSDFKKDKIKAKSSYSIRGEQNIMTEISTNGPVTAAFTVYNDFLAYKSGVYKHVSGQELGGHAIEIIGYGEDNGTKYWLVKNSWNPSWGDGGFFKIQRGSDECGIESSVVAGHAA